MSDTDNTTPTTDGQGRADIIAQAREALCERNGYRNAKGEWIGSRIDNPLEPLAPALARIAIAHEAWLTHERKVCEAAGDRAGVIAYSRALAAFQAAKEGK